MHGQAWFYMVQALVEMAAVPGLNFDIMPIHHHEKTPEQLVLWYERP